MGQPAQIADDPGERGADDVLVERGQGQRQHQPGKDDPALSGGDGRGCLGVGHRGSFLT